MLELLADTGPGALPLWAVVVWAAGMYPLGLLFGACSECCDGCQPCGRCNNANDYCDAIGSVTVQFERGDSISTATFNSGDEYCDPLLCECVTLDIAPEQTLEQGYDFGECYFNRPWDIKADFILRTRQSLNDCGCDILELLIEITISFIGESDGIFLPAYICQQEFVAPIKNSCIPASGTVVVPLVNDYSCNAEICQAETEAFAMALGDITISYQTSGCDCGACCEDAACVENVAESACLGEWQGVGTDCDPNPCQQPGACCVNGECYQAVESQCDIDGGAWQAGPCDPNPC